MAKVNTSLLPVVKKHKVCHPQEWWPIEMLEVHQQKIAEEGQQTGIYNKYK